MTNIFTKYWSSGNTLTADDLNANFDDVSNILNGGIKNEHLSSSANIAAEKIADRFYIVKTSIEVIPFSGGGTATTFAQSGGAETTTEFHIPITETTITKHEVIAQSGYQGHLMAVGVYAKSVSVSTADWGRIGIFLNNSLVGQRITLDTNDANYRLHANSPFSNPLLAIADGDIIAIKLGSSGSNVPTARGVTVTLMERWAIGS